MGWGKVNSYDASDWRRVPVAAVEGGAGDDVRPTPDRLRETLFNILAPWIEGVTFVDAYAGTGAVGIEAVSRGAARAILMEKSRQALEVLEENVASLGIQGRVKVLRGSARLLLRRHEGISCFRIRRMGSNFRLARYSGGIRTEHMSGMTSRPTGMV